jgi:hypothetical protein
MRYSDLFALLVVVGAGVVGYFVYAHYSRQTPDAAAEQKLSQAHPSSQQKQQTPGKAPPPPAPTKASPTPASGQSSQLAVGKRVDNCPPGGQAAPGGPELRPGDAPKFQLTLPSGLILNDAVMDVPPNWQESNLPHSAQVFVMPYPNGSPHGIFAVKDGRCHGASASLHPDGSLCTLAYYKKGQLAGPLRLWEPDHRRLLYAEYVNGQRSGPLCLFIDNRPCLVQQWKYDKLAEEYFVKTEGAESLLIPQADLSANDEDARRFAAAQNRLNDLLAEVENNERTIKQSIAKSCRKESERVKRERAAVQTAAKREAMLARTEARNAAKAAAWESYLQHALRASAW